MDGAVLNFSASNQAFQDADDPLEQRLKSLKSFATIALDECRQPLTDALGSAQVRWEIHSTWTLLLCIHHAEAEFERCKKKWQRTKWQTEAQALQHIFMEHRSVRLLSGVLIWLRWSHCGACPDSTPAECEASYRQTRTTLQRHQWLPNPLQEHPMVHPDGPLQQRAHFHEEDLKAESILLQRLWVHLRRGELLDGALTLCNNSGQAWRAALLQGMFPFANDADEPAPLSFATDADDKEETKLIEVKQHHTDWTEIGTPNSPGASDGNPWRRVWKEQCWKTAQRNLASDMDMCELGMYGFCSGHREAMLPLCKTRWADRCWCELHCLKEWLIERLLDLGRDECCEDPQMFLGEGDAGTLDVLDSPQERLNRVQILCGCFHDVKVADIETKVACEVARILSQIQTVSEQCGVKDPVVLEFEKLQATLIQAAWLAEKSKEACDILRGWLSEGLCGDKKCPYLVKQFASYLAIWQSEGSPTTMAKDQVIPQDIDDIVIPLVADLAESATNSVKVNCCDGQTIELIAEHVSAMSQEGRFDTYSSFVLRLGMKGGIQTCTSAQHAAQGAERSKAFGESMEVLTRAMWVFWTRFPCEALAFLAFFVQKVLSDDAAYDEHRVNQVSLDYQSQANPDEIRIALLCIVAGWAVLKEVSEDAFIAREAARGLDLIFEAQSVFKTVPQDVDELPSTVLDILLLPLLHDLLLSYIIKDEAGALALLPHLQDSFLWHSAVELRTASFETIADLEFYLRLLEKQHSLLARAGEGEDSFIPASGHGGIPGAANSPGPMVLESRQAAFHNFLDDAHLRLASDRPFLASPPGGTQTCLTAHQNEGMQLALVWRVLMLLLSAFENESDFNGAMHDLTVAVAQSPWVLQLLQPQHARSFLSRLAQIPSVFLQSKGDLFGR